MSEIERIQHLPITVHQYDISSEGQSRLDEVPIEVAPCDNSNDVEWLLDQVELNTVPISNMSIDSKSAEMESDVDTEKSPLTLVLENQL